MMKIAIFDTDYKNSELLKRLIYDFSNYRRLELVVETFTNISDLVNFQYDYTLYFISFTTESGLKIVEKLHQNRIKVPIIITSNNRSHAADAFKFNAYNFLEFPTQKDTLFRILNNYFKEYFARSLIISHGFESVCINTDDIQYIEAFNKHCILHLKNGNIECGKTMSHVLAVLTDNRFIKISRFFTVNSDYVTTFNSDLITLENGAELHPSRNFYRDFKRYFLRIHNPIIL